ncbi:MAG TPA: MMPL family transporter [Candidatus Dormibacteraeota bacterium]|nr:MMPL family transporter [Candidatus Dormibacteraeota bacterium]
MEGPRSLATAWGGLVARRRWAFIAAWALLAVVLAVFASGTSRLLSPAGFETDTEASRAADVLRQQFPERRDPVLTVVLQSDRTPIADPGYQAQVAAWRADLERLTGAGGVVEGPLLGRDGRTAALIVSSNRSPDHFIELGRQASRITHPGPAHVLIGGFGAVYDTFIEGSEQDLQQSERLSVPIALGLLLLVFGGVVAGLLPVLTGLATVTAAVALLGFVARVHTVSVFSLNITSVVGLGLGIDYSLLIVNRFREEIRRGRDVEAAVATTVGTAGLATVVSGGTVAIGFGALTLSRLNVLWSIGAGGALVVAVSVLASLTLIPALLAVFGRNVDRLSLPFARTMGGGRFWHALAARVMARPMVFIAAALAVVAILVAPARSLRLGVVGAESLPPGDPAARATRLAQDQLGFPPYAPVLVVASGVATPAQAAEVERRLRQAAGGQPVTGPADVPPERVPLYLRGGYAVFEVQQPAGDNDDATHRWLDRIRATSWPAGVRVQLGGEAPAYQDFLRVLVGDAPLIVGTVLALTFVLLALAFRSAALPVKAVLMNLLSVGAALGVLTWAFQDGGLASPLQFRAVGFVDATAPVIIFAGLFGLSMDYEVFLLSRIREEWAAGRSNAAAVAFGMERTGRIITSAALILVVVVSTLGLSHLTLNKSFGVTFAVAILLDATVIRLLLVPAMMRVLGDLNWWPARRRSRADEAAAA